MSKKKVLEIKNLSKFFTQGEDKIEVLSNLNLEIYRGELVAIIGSSGCGKSTLLQIAGLLDKQSSGEIIYNENILESKMSFSDREKMRLEYLGFVYQYHHLLKDFNARENIAMPALIKGEDYDEALIRADKMLDKLQIYDKRFNYPPQLSGGQQQRVAIARALFHKPSLVLADEPTGNLDPSTSHIVFDLFMKLVRKENCAAIIVTHNTDLAKKADRVITLR